MKAGAARVVLIVWNRLNDFWWQQDYWHECVNGEAEGITSVGSIVGGNKVRGRTRTTDNGNAQILQCLFSLGDFFLNGCELSML